MESILCVMRKIEFTPNLEKMIKVNEEILKEWENKYASCHDNPFAVLYKICGGIEN